MTRAEAYTLLDRLAHNELVKEAHRVDIANLRDAVCKDDGSAIIMRTGWYWLYMIESSNIVDAKVKDSIAALQKATREGYEMCAGGISHEKCGDCPNNNHFSWEDD